MAFRALKVAACTLLLAVGTNAARLPFNVASVSSAIADLAQTAADGAVGHRHLQEASSTGSGMGMMAAISPQLQSLAGTSAASNAAGNTGASAAAAVTSAINSLGASSGASISKVSDVQVVLEGLLAQFCSDAEFTAPKNMSASWIGGGATIALIPHTCLIYPDTNTLKCSPAQLVLYRTEGSYNKAYVSAAKWEGKECKIQQQLGKGSVEVVGGAPYKVNVPATPVFKSLWTPVFANQSVDLGVGSIPEIADTKAEDTNPAVGGASGAAAAAASGGNNKGKTHHDDKKGKKHDDDKKTKSSNDDKKEKKNKNDDKKKNNNDKKWKHNDNDKKGKHNSNDKKGGNKNYDGSSASASASVGY